MSHAASVFVLIVGDPICLDLGRRQFLGHLERHFVQADLLAFQRVWPTKIADDRAVTYRTQF